MVPPQGSTKRSSSPRKKAASGSETTSRYAKNEKKHKTRPKSAPKHRPSSTSHLDHYPPSNEDEGVEDFSEEELRLQDDSSAVSDQDFMGITDQTTNVAAVIPMQPASMPTPTTAADNNKVI